MRVPGQKSLGLIERFDVEPAGHRSAGRADVFVEGPCEPRDAVEQNQTSLPCSTIRLDREITS